jgi:hypothetical protein
MSGPVSTTDAPPAVADCGHPSAPCVEVTDSRDEQVGQIRVRRALPRKGRRTVGAWCFADHMGPADVTENSGLDVGPHPHIGLQNLMTSGGAVSHAEEATGHYRGTLEGIQLWVALPEATRHGGAAFEHHAQLPQSELDGGVATVLVGATRFPSGRRVGPNAARVAVRRVRCAACGPYGRGSILFHGFSSRRRPVAALQRRHTTVTRSASRPVAGCTSSQSMCEKRLSPALFTGRPHSVWLVPGSQA